MRIPFPGTYGHIHTLQKLSGKSRNECYMQLIKYNWVTSAAMRDWGIDIGRLKKWNATLHRYEDANQKNQNVEAA